MRLVCLFRCAGGEDRMKARTTILASVVALVAGLAEAGPAAANIRLLLAAGGGGGSAVDYEGEPGTGSVGVGGVGAGGAPGSFIGWETVFNAGGGGGAGWLVSGELALGDFAGGGGLSLPTFAGGAGFGEGGYGGGGGGGYGGGGGGGFWGGNGGDVTDLEILGRIDPEGFGGGGGGSYIDPAFTNTVSEDGVNYGNGVVEINSTVIPYTGGNYDYIVPATGLYNIVAFGAEGGVSYSPPGLGAEVGGYVTLDKGTVLAIVVGGAGGPLGVPNGAGGGGGGGSFVWEAGAVVPEPSTWALTLLGFAVLCGLSGVAKDRRTIIPSQRG